MSNMLRWLFLLTFVPRKIKEFWFMYYNRFLFTLAGVKFGRKMKIATGFTLKKYQGAQLLIGDDFCFTSGSTINPISRNIKGCIFVNTNAKLAIGNDVGISSACIWCDESITIGNIHIGNDVTIAPNAVVVKDIPDGMTVGGIPAKSLR